MKNLSKNAEEFVFRTKRRVESIKCDKCNRMIMPTNYQQSVSKYFRVVTRHEDWGNDSIESTEFYDNG